MTTEEKARAMFDAADECAGEYRREGNNAVAELVTEAFADLPRESAARLFDILTRQR